MLERVCGACVRFKRSCGVDCGDNDGICMVDGCGCDANDEACSFFAKQREKSDDD